MPQFISIDSLNVIQLVSLVRKKDNLLLCIINTYLLDSDSPYGQTVLNLTTATGDLDMITLKKDLRFLRN